MSTATAQPATDSPRAASAADATVFRIGRESHPFLSDHGFQGMTVLPGSYYFELALRHLGETGLALSNRISGVEFRQPLILPDQNVDVAVDLTWLNARRVRYSFREASAPPSMPNAHFEIESGEQLEFSSPPHVDAPENFQATAAQIIDGATFYRQLKKNGNEYGARFQGLRRLWRSGDEGLAQFSPPVASDAAEKFLLDPVVVDSAIQSLMIFGLDRGRTMVLHGIDTLTFRRRTRSGDSWVSTRLQAVSPGAPDALIGDIDVRDDSGACWLELRGVKLTFHENNVTKPTTPAATNLVVAATFTAEPIEEVFRFWSDTLIFPTRVSFAPYGQVFQQLLDPNSLFHRNRDGANLILLNLADWAADREPAAKQANTARAADAFRDLETSTLPNGLKIAHLNQHETDYVYREIFEDRCYLRHGVRLPAGATVIDIGANIGLFSLFVRREAPDATVFAYEPSPAAFRALKANCETYGPGLHPFNAGVSDRRGEATLTCYEKSSVFSSFHPDHREDERAIRSVITNVVRGALPESAAPTPDLVDELLVGRLNSQTLTCPMVSVSDIVRENHLRRIDLLKIDAEKCEMEILRGIEDAHWPLIEQVVVEVHDRTRVLVDEVQEMLAKRGFHCAVVEEELLAGSGLFNVYATRGRAGVSERADDERAERMSRNVQRTADEFVEALTVFSRNAKAPTLLCLCPSATKTSGSLSAPTLVQIEGEMLRRVRTLPQVHALGSEEILGRYAAADFHNPHSRELGHIPYTADGFAAIGTSLFRMLAALRRPPLKVIALDCDHTLWQGTCGEDGPLGVVITPAHRALQEFMLSQMEAGMILCLCSKNHDSDVWPVFATNPGMVLRREHFAAARINWSPKSDNLRSLARELNVGLDSIILLDDNPLECAEVRAKCPEVVVLALPADATAVPQFLEHVWAFDHVALTAEDRARTRLLAEGEQREKFRTTAPTLQEFIAGLDLHVEIFPPDTDLLTRVAQLTQRTNQFNFSTVRRTESEMRQFLENENHHCLAINVTDRFGDYGTVGVLLYAQHGDCRLVDTFLLSCRVLGRGVEHRVLAEFAARTVADGAAWIEFTFSPTEKNQPAANFLASLRTASEQPAGADRIYRFRASELAGLRYQPEPSKAAPKEAQPPVSLGAAAQSPEKFEAMARDLNDAKKISAAVEARRLRAAGFATTSPNGDLPDTLSGKILGLWRRILGNPRLSLDDKFMEAGGTSLKAVQIVAAMRTELQLPVSVVAFFECPTVRLLSEKLSPKTKPSADTSEAMARGARRTQRLGKRSAPASTPDVLRPVEGGTPV